MKIKILILFIIMYTIIYIPVISAEIYSGTTTLIRTDRELFIEYINKSLCRPDRSSEWNCVDYSFDVYKHNPD